MITERKYKNALAIVEQYKKEQELFKLDKIKSFNVSLSSELYDLYQEGLISSKLMSFLYQYYKSYVLVQDIDKPLTLEFFTGINQYGFSNWYGVGKKTLDEFINIMAAAGHIVPKD